jgi:mannosyl-3-phosphoglycerate phosphatase family protein
VSPSLLALKPHRATSQANQQGWTIRTRIRFRVDNDGGQGAGVLCPPLAFSEIAGIPAPSSRVTLFPALLAPRHLIFSALDGALVDPRTGSSTDAEETLSELEHLKIPLVLMSPRTRAEIEPVRRQLGHNHPFVTENGGGIFFPDGYMNVKIPGAVRNARYLCIAQGRPYEEVCAALDEIAEQCGVGVAGFHHMNLREIADNTGLRPRDAELARSREYDEPFYFTSADEAGIARFVESAREKGFQARPGGMFWHFSSGCDPARAVRTLTQLFREAAHIKLRTVGVGADSEDIEWLQAVDQAVLLPGKHAEIGPSRASQSKTIVPGNAPGPAGWSETILNIIS